MDYQQRLIWIDSLKGWLMVLVVIGHAIQSVLKDACYDNSVWNFIYSFHMPAFVALSGWLMYKKKVNCESVHGEYFKLIKRRFFQLMIPYFLWSIIKLSFSGCFTIKRIIGIVLFPDTSFWFLWVLFWIWLLFTLGQKVSNLISVDELIVLLIMSIFLMGGMAIFELRFFGFQFISYYFIFYILGYMFHRFGLFARLNDKLVLLCLLIWLCLALGWNMHSLPSWIPSIPYVPSSLVQYSYRGLTATFAIIVLLYYSPHRLIKTCGFHRLIAWSGKVSLGIYVVHLILLGFITGFLQSLDFSLGSIIYIIISALFVYLLSIACVYVLMKNKYTARYLLGKI